MTRSSEIPQQRLQVAIDAAATGILMSDARGLVVLANRQVESLFGYAREELLGRPVAALVAENLRDRFAAQLSMPPAVTAPRLIGAGGELRGLRKDGTEFPMEIGLTSVSNDEGSFVVHSITDISSRNRAEERLRIIVESSPSGMVMIDATGRIVLVNREIERMFGYPRSELLGQPIETLVPESIRENHRVDRAAFLKQPQARAMGIGRDLHGVRKDGTDIPLEIGLNPIATDEGVFVLASVLDISARKRADEERRRLEDQLRQAQKMEAIGRLASGIAHDFNNVLMGIMSCGALVKHALPSDHPARSLVDDISSAAERGASLSRDLLNFSRPKPVDAIRSQLNDVVRVAERMLRPMIGEDIALEVELCASGGPILGNPTHLEHILLNLAVNARDAMPNGGRLRIETRDAEFEHPIRMRGHVLAPGSYVSLIVEDSGTGMDAATREKLFEPFFTTKEVGTGTGLGLYTVYSIVKQLEGGVDVESAPGAGTRFTLHFPRLGLLTKASAAAVAPVRAGIPVRDSARILVVEDEPLIRTSMVQILSRLGYEVVGAESGAGALACTGRFDLLISDMVLPDTSGAELAQVMTGERPTLEVLFMSAYPNELLVHQGRIKRGTPSLVKPFDEETLAHAVSSALAMRRARPESAPPATA